MVYAGGFNGHRHLASAELYNPQAGRCRLCPRCLIYEGITQEACISHANSLLLHAYHFYDGLLEVLSLITLHMKVRASKSDEHAKR